ncbi:MAG: molybdate ABC transporter substrate-binding protein [Deltaproteobacteria bacterium]|jgi:molybdate transport system substrate-binding protein|nr:molybdate ABC transporter substrate-binding protein [Deltaproteobacteria bacterium]
MKKFLFLLACLSLFIPGQLSADEFNVAVASNFQKPAELIAAQFEADTGHKAILTFGSTGAFETQIKNGSPVAILLAANTKTPKNLDEAGFAKPGSIFTYALGALLLWSAEEGYVDDKGEVLKTGDYEHIAVANPEAAPYGFAAYELLKAWDLLDKLQNEKRISEGTNIKQTAQFVESGAAKLGLIAKSEKWENGAFNGSGSYWLVDTSLYSPIVQDAVIIEHAKDNEAVQAFADYLKSDKAKEIILSFGYQVPEK